MRGPFAQHGARIWQVGGRPFIPTGYNVSGLERANWADFTAADNAEIDAAAAVYCANTVRLQVGQWNLNHGGPDFMAAFQAEVSRAEALGLVVVINDQAEWNPDAQPMPTQASKAAYSVHHPAGPHTRANWDHQFGYLATRQIAPVVNGEWTNWGGAPCGVLA